MILSIIFVFIVILWIVIGTSTLKLHPFLVLLIGGILLGFLLDLDPISIMQTLLNGFAGTMKSVGFLILFGTLIGTSLQHSSGANVLAIGVLRYLHKLPLPIAISCIGYLVSIPVFCDAAFVILAQLNKSLAQKTKTSFVGLSVALSTGLFAPHVLIPPTPGPLAAAANLDLANLFPLIITGSIIGLILILTGGLFALYISKLYPYRKEVDLKKPILEPKEDKTLPSFNQAILPILLPLLFMCIGALIPKSVLTTQQLELVNLLSNPLIALAIGAIFGLRLLLPVGSKSIYQSFLKGVKQAFPILIITGMGGALGAVIGKIPLHEYLEILSGLERLGLLIPFLIAALLKTAQGSSTVAIITASSIVFPLLPIIQLESEMGKVWVVMAIGTGAMTVSHANDSYFWIVSQISGMDVKTAYRTHTLGTLIQGTLGIVLVFIGFYLRKIIF